MRKVTFEQKKEEREKVQVIRNLEECIGIKRGRGNKINSQAHTDYSTVKAIFCQLKGFV